MKTAIYWLARVTIIAYTLLITLFALDAFNEAYTLRENILAFVIHLLPTIILVLSIYIAWKKHQIGGLIFIAMGLAYTIITWGKFPTMSLIIIAGPLYFSGLLFLIQSHKQKADDTVHIQGEKTDITQMT